MATLGEILGKKWPGVVWELEGDVYATLVWRSGTPKPSETEIRAFSAEVDTMLAAEAREARWRDHLEASDSLLQALEALAEAVADIQAKARVTSPLTSGAITKINVLIQRLTSIRSQ